MSALRGRVIGTLALTLGATTAVFSIVNGVLLRPLAYREAQRLVSIREVLPQIADRYPSLPANARHFEEWRTRATLFVAMTELDWRTTALTGAALNIRAGLGAGATQVFGLVLRQTRRRCSLVWRRDVRALWRWARWSRACCSRCGRAIRS